MMSAIGTGAVREGIVSMSLGTSGTVYAFSKKPLIDPKGEIAAFCDSTGGWLPLGCTLNLARVTDQFASLLRLDRKRFEKAAELVPPGSEGLHCCHIFRVSALRICPVRPAHYRGSRCAPSPEHTSRARRSREPVGADPSIA